MGAVSSEEPPLLVPLLGQFSPQSAEPLVWCDFLKTTVNWHPICTWLLALTERTRSHRIRCCGTNLVRHWRMEDGVKKQWKPTTGHYSCHPDTSGPDTTWASPASTWGLTSKWCFDPLVLVRGRMECFFFYGNRFGFGCDFELLIRQRFVVLRIFKLRHHAERLIRVISQEKLFRKRKKSALFRSLKTQKFGSTRANQAFASMLG